MRNNNKRPRGRQQSNKRPVNPKFQNFDSNGPDGRVRGNAQQVYEKYVSLAKDATDDPVLAENYYQHAEHYHRILQAAQEWENQRREERGENNRQRNNRGRDDRNDGQSNQNDEQQGDTSENAENASNNGDDNNTPVEADKNAAEASEDDGGKPKRAPRARRSDTRSTGRGRPRKSDEATAEESAPAETSGDDATANTDGAESGDEGEKKPRRAASSSARTRGRHPTARRGRSRAAGREDEEGATSDEGSEPVSA
ncbi:MULTISPECIES: DUF4167 domain-containing protein [Thalassospira]|jgi:hypothetical protein|uniref:DUF4167 domain-containing protein n=1 Tax=Thalassospira profundimaris TaxID=502049 RepID=A0A367V400_9PROT|nr:MULTISPECIES: DUF4167 domain-containing protein [Thalassospira]KZB70549.1 hypothetical protein AUQ43_06610 [Thalassospira sp. MCCC 1A01148]RCK19904.1 hypothetical protein TH6_18015 [Thalassospira profundimaris]